jgi:hypothetical protein
MLKITGARVAALVVVATGAAFFISCQDSGEPAGFTATETDDHSVSGTCYDLFNHPTSNITCKIYCETCSEYIYTVDISNPDYTCVPAPPDYASHEGDTAHAEGYDPWNNYWGRSPSFEIEDGGNEADIYEE